MSIGKHTPRSQPTSTSVHSVLQHPTACFLHGVVLIRTPTARGAMVATSDQHALVAAPSSLLSGSGRRT
eukprot:COSAG01_NODE_724_length_14056_cov_41.795443_9_plen_69_part_00